MYHISNIRKHHITARLVALALVISFLLAAMATGSASYAAPANTHNALAGATNSGHVGSMSARQGLDPDCFVTEEGTDDAKTYNGFLYITIEGEAYIVDYIGKKKNITIPARIEGKKVIQVIITGKKLRKVRIKKNNSLLMMRLTRNKITSINVKNAKNLEVLQLKYNRLKKLDVSKNKNLSYLSVDKKLPKSRLNKLLRNLKPSKEYEHKNGYYWVYFL